MEDTQVLIQYPDEYHHSKTTAMNHRLIFQFVFRIGVFIAIEMGFIILASLATSNSRLLSLNLSSSISLTEAKGAFTVISVVWHSLAVFSIKEILLRIFSAEWMAQVRRSGKLIIRETDIVSRMTTGYLEQIAYLRSGNATVSFRIGFMCTLLLLVLNGLGPSAITVNSILTQQPVKIKIANLTLTENLANGGEQLLAPDRANTITRLEQLENSTYSFRGQQSNLLIPWPSPDLISSNQTIYYHSDVITYNFSCTWHVPSGNLTNGLRIDGNAWFISSGRFDYGTTPALDDATILPLEMEGEIGESVKSPIVSFIFVGSNTTLSDRVAMNLEDVPTLLFSASDLSGSDGDVVDSEAQGLMTALVCDPRLEIH
ncbi:hypothetical protein NP233_g9710 [Leucocoprinus birnbaumii]|uniref:Uncharacterized protein n=1 Tax=Leucocoprinus birnbaumii TaxID=56174 RepID=A0AAD5VNF5_9AGAR|nr:hypothetical protein NP233_g9710 [Leucocoprinus birnbaumii]